MAEAPRFTATLAKAYSRTKSNDVGRSVYDGEMEQIVYPAATCVGGFSCVSASASRSRMMPDKRVRLAAAATEASPYSRLIMFKRNLVFDRANTMST